MAKLERTSEHSWSKN